MTAKKSSAKIAFQLIHSKRLWRFFGKEGFEIVAAEIYPAPFSVSYYQWLKSRYLVQRILGLPLDRLVKLSLSDRERLKGLRMDAKG